MELYAMFRTDALLQFSSPQTYERFTMIETQLHEAVERLLNVTEEESRRTLRAYRASLKERELRKVQAYGFESKPLPGTLSGFNFLCSLMAPCAYEIQILAVEETRSRVITAVTLDSGESYSVPMTRVEQRTLRFLSRPSEQRYCNGSAARESMMVALRGELQSLLGVLPEGILMLWGEKRKSAQGLRCIHTGTEIRSEPLVLLIDMLLYAL